jgi:drug/metabolite transporter (DMT)-like permease
VNSPDRTTSGLSLAFLAAAISGLAVFINSYGVRAVKDATVYTTAKNLVAAAVLVAVVLSARSMRPKPVQGTKRLALLGVVALIGGSVPFVLFFEGLARATSTHAAFIHKTLFLWVAVLAVPLLGERLRAAHLLAAGLLVGGLLALEGGLGGFSLAGGELLILAATLLWSAETVVVKRLLSDVAPMTVALARMGVGSAALVAWVAVSGRWATLTSLGANGWLWAAVTGAILGCYVLTWFTALARAQAVDVTAILVAGAVITALLKGTPQVGLILIAVGAVVVAVSASHRRLEFG